MAEKTLVLPDDLQSELESVSRRQQRPESEIVGDALREYFRHHGDAPWPKYVGMASDGSFNAADDEKYLAERWNRE